VGLVDKAWKRLMEVKGVVQGSRDYYRKNNGGTYGMIICVSASSFIGIQGFSMAGSRRRPIVCGIIRRLVKI
jgi:hypothetical protein